MHAIIFDCETTGKTDPQVIETAWVKISDPVSLIGRHIERARWKPSKAIELGALATHHIMDEDLTDCAPSSDFRLPDGTEYLIGHNIDYDWEAIGKPPVKRICTLALSRKLWPEADSHTLSAMLYLLVRSEASQLLVNAHSAAADVANCYRLLCCIKIRLAQDRVRPLESWEELWQISERARIPEIVTFGKHKGARFSDLPADYKAWYLRQAEQDPYVAKAMRGGDCLMRRGSKHGIDRREYALRIREFVLRGEALPQARLNPQLVRELRRTRYLIPARVWAKKLAVSERCIEDARRGLTWSHVT